MVSKLVSFERRFTALEKEMKRNPHDRNLFVEFVKLQKEFDNYVRNRI